MLMLMPMWSLLLDLLTLNLMLMADAVVDAGADVQALLMLTLMLKHA